MPMAPVPTMAEVLQTPHWRERGSFQSFVDAERAFEGPAMPFRLRQRGATGAERANDVAGQHSGPLSGLRVIDLSMAAARLLGMVRQGVGTVSLSPG